MKDGLPENQPEESVTASIYDIWKYMSNAYKNSNPDKDWIVDIINNWCKKEEEDRYLINAFYESESYPGEEHKNIITKIESKIKFSLTQILPGRHLTSRHINSLIIIELKKIIRSTLRSFIFISKNLGSSKNELTFAKRRVLNALQIKEEVKKGEKKKKGDLDSTTGKAIFYPNVIRSN